MDIQNVTLAIVPSEGFFNFAVTVAGQLIFNDNEINAVPQKEFRMAISLFAADKEEDEVKEVEEDKFFHEEESEKNRKLYTFAFRESPYKYLVVKPKQHVQEFSVTRTISGSTLDEDPATIQKSFPEGVKIVPHTDEVYARVVLSILKGSSYQLGMARSNIVTGKFGALG